jgi:fructokinase
MLFGALEAGGTKMICAIGDENGNILHKTSFPTEDTAVTMPKIINYFKDKSIEALGIGCFGPIDVNPKSSTYGFITTTPKIAWRNYDIVGDFKKTLNVPIGFDTDVNGSVLGEVTFGCAKDLDCVVYITIGTGVGVGVFLNGQLLHGMLHPEAGHMLMRVREDDIYSGKCPYHGSCLEGLAAGPAIEERWGSKAIELKDNHNVWELEAYYIGQAITNFIYIYSPQKIILGGGVMHQMQLFPLIRDKVKQLNSNYINTKELLNLDTYIVPSSLNDDQGIMGAIELGKKAYYEDI